LPTQADLLIRIFMLSSARYGVRHTAPATLLAAVLIAQPTVRHLHRGAIELDVINIAVDYGRRPDVC